MQLVRSEERVRRQRKCARNCVCKPPYPALSSDVFSYLPPVCAGQLKTHTSAYYHCTAVNTPPQQAPAVPTKKNTVLRLTPCAGVHSRCSSPPRRPLIPALVRFLIFMSILKLTFQRSAEPSSAPLRRCGGYAVRKERYEGRNACVFHAVLVTW